MPTGQYAVVRLYPLSLLEHARGEMNRSFFVPSSSILDKTLEQHLEPKILPYPFSILDGLFSLLSLSCNFVAGPNPFFQICFLELWDL